MRRTALIMLALLIFYTLRGSYYCFGRSPSLLFDPISFYFVIVKNTYFYILLFTLM